VVISYPNGYQINASYFLAINIKKNSEYKNSEKIQDRERQTETDRERQRQRVRGKDRERQRE
jgi:hypothetical protein